jgi:hypothetical protein
MSFVKMEIEPQLWTAVAAAYDRPLSQSSSKLWPLVEVFLG